MEEREPEADRACEGTEAERRVEKTTASSARAEWDGYRTRSAGWSGDRMPEGVPGGG